MHLKTIDQRVSRETSGTPSLFPNIRHRRQERDQARGRCVGPGQPGLENGSVNVEGHCGDPDSLPPGCVASRLSQREPAILNPMQALQRVGPAWPAGDARGLTCDNRARSTHGGHSWVGSQTARCCGSGRRSAEGVGSPWWGWSGRPRLRGSSPPWHTGA